MSSDEQKRNEKIVIRPDEVARQMPPMARAVPQMSPDKVYFAVVIVAVVAVVVIGVVLAITLNGSTEDQVSPSGMGHSSRQSNATLAYWNKLRQVGYGLEKGKAESSDIRKYAAQLQEQRSALDLAIGEITRLPTLDVDRDAIEVGARTAEFLGELDALLSSLERLVRDAEALGTRATSAELMVESFVRGFFGDPFGTTIELQAEQGKLSDRHQRILEQAEVLQSRANNLRTFGSRTRAELTARYEIEFPPLE